jgi:peptide/nickel transport system permease protein
MGSRPPGPCQTPVVWRSALRRIVAVVAVLLGVTFLSQVFLEVLPGDPAVVIAGMTGSRAAVEAVRKQLELDRPIHERYVRWLGRAVQGDLGRSGRYNGPVLDVLLKRGTRTFQVLVGALAVAVIVAVPFGILAGYRAGGASDRLVSAGAVIAIGIPPFALGNTMILFFALKLGWLPALGYKSPIGEPWEGFRHLLLPSITLGLPLAGLAVRALRTDVAATVAQGHVLTARANGLSTWRILTRHVLRQSSLTMLSVIGVNLPWVFSFLVLVERLFNLAGAGELITQGISGREFALVQGTILAFAVLYVALNLIIDLLTNVIDPRRRRPVLAS